MTETITRGARLRLLRNNITLWRYRCPHPVALFMPSTLPVHDGCRIYKCQDCGAKNSRPFRNGRDLNKWARRHKRECLTKRLDSRAGHHPS